MRELEEWRGCSYRLAPSAARRAKALDIEPLPGTRRLLPQGTLQFKSTLLTGPAATEIAGISTGVEFLQVQLAKGPVAEQRNGFTVIDLPPTAALANEEA